MREIRTLRSVGAGGGSSPLATRCEGSNVLAYSENEPCFSLLSRDKCNRCPASSVSWINHLRICKKSLANFVIRGSGGSSPSAEQPTRVPCDPLAQSRGSYGEFFFGGVYGIASNAPDFVTTGTGSQKSLSSFKLHCTYQELPVSWSSRMKVHTFSVGWSV